MFQVSEKKEKIRKIANKKGWKEIDCKRNPGMVAFSKIVDNQKYRIKIWFSSMYFVTVGTFINHPEKRDIQSFRRNVELKTIMEIISDHRLHIRKE